MLPGVLELEFSIYYTLLCTFTLHNILFHSQKAWDQKGLGKGEGLVSSCIQLQMYSAHNQRSGRSVE